MKKDFERLFPFAVLFCLFLRMLLQQSTAEAVMRDSENTHQAGILQCTFCCYNQYDIYISGDESVILQ